jgi:hypothetical protein
MEYINIRKILKEGKSKKLSRLPDFVYTIFEKVLHLNEINQILTEYKDDKGVDFLCKLMD